MRMWKKEMEREGKTIRALQTNRETLGFSANSENLWTPTATEAIIPYSNTQLYIMHPLLSQNILFLHSLWRPKLHRHRFFPIAVTGQFSLLIGIPILFPANPSEIFASQAQSGLKSWIFDLQAGHFRRRFTAWGGRFRGGAEFLLLGSWVS